MPVDDAILTENATQLQRVKSLAGRLSDADLQRDAGGGWTVAVVFAHLAFWDRVYLGVLSDWGKAGHSPTTPRLRRGPAQRWPP